MLNATPFPTLAGLCLVGVCACASAGPSRQAETASGVAPADRTVVSFESLREAGGSLPVMPPDVREQLDAAFAVDARNARIEGGARVALRIEADGTTSDLRVVSATAPSFGTGCLGLLERMRFEPARTVDGEAVAVVTTFVCEFELAE